MTDLNELLDMDYAPSWYPQEGDKLIGDVVDIGERDAGWGPYRIFTVRISETPTPVRMEDGEAKVGDQVAWHAIGAVASSESASVKRGQKIGVKRERDKPNPKGGKDMKIWKVRAIGDMPVSARTSAPAADVVDDGPSADELI